MNHVKRLVSYILLIGCISASQTAIGFNGDLYADLIIGVPYEDIDSIEDSGGFHLLKGAVGGLTDWGNQFYSQEDFSAEDACESADMFAYSIISGDFNGDYYSDLVVGVPWEDIDTIGNAGVVQVIYGSSQGFQMTNPAPDYFSQDTQGIPGGAEENDWFGWALASGDFNHDGFDDLAISAPGEAIGDLSSAGAVWIIPGSATGLITPDSLYFHQNDLGSENPTEAGDQFGEALATGDLNGDDFADLIIGSRGESIDEVDTGEGCIHTMYGSASGLTASGSQCFWQGKDSAIPGVPETYDGFGEALSVADFNSDGFDDIAVSAWGEDIASVGSNAGIVHIFNGSAAGATTDGNITMSPGAENDEFGYSLSSGDINGDGFMDLIVGSPGCDFDSVNRTGAIYTYLGSAQGLDISSLSKMYQGEGVLPDSSEEGDRCGSALACADFDADGYWDVAISAMSQNVDSVEIAGAVMVVRGSESGLVSTGAQFWTQNTGELFGSAELADFFGQTLAVSKPRSPSAPCPATGVSISMPDTMFFPGDTCGCAVTVCNAGDAAVSRPLFVILDVAGSFFFAPSFGNFDNYLDLYPSFPFGSTLVTVLPPFVWPSGAGSFTGCTWYAAMTNPQMTALYGEMGTWTFGWAQ